MAEFLVPLQIVTEGDLMEEAAVPLVLDDTIFQMRDNFICLFCIHEASTHSFTLYLALCRDGVTYYECEEVFTPTMILFQGSDVLDDAKLFRESSGWSKTYAKRVAHLVLCDLKIIHNKHTRHGGFVLSWNEDEVGFYTARSSHAA